MFLIFYVLPVIANICWSRLLFFQWSVGKRRITRRLEKGFDSENTVLTMNNRVSVLDFVGLISTDISNRFLNILVYFCRELQVLQEYTKIFMNLSVIRTSLILAQSAQFYFLIADFSYKTKSVKNCKKNFLHIFTPLKM